MKYTHAGVEIELVEATGTFRATVGGERVTAPSLTAIKAKIDKANKFAQFTGLVDKGRFGMHKDKERYQPVVIVGIKRSRAATYRGDSQWVTSTGEHVSEVFKHTPESLASLKAYDALVDIQKKEKEEMDVQHRAAIKVADLALHRHMMPVVK